MKFLPKMAKPANPQCSSCHHIDVGRKQSVDRARSSSGAQAQLRARISAVAGRESELWSVEPGIVPKLTGV